MHPFPSMLNAGGGYPGFTYDPANKAAAAALSEADLTLTVAGSSASAAYGTVSHSSLKYCFEVLIVGVGTSATMGLGRTGASVAAGAFVGFDVLAWGYNNSGTVFNNNASVASYASFTTGDVITCYFNSTLGKAWFAKNGTVQSGSPSGGTGGVNVVTSPEIMFPGGSAKGGGVVKLQYPQYPISGFAVW